MPRQVPRHHVRSWAREALRTLVLVAGVLGARATFADQYTVPSGSMEPTVQVADRVLVHKAAYGLRVPLSDVYLVRFAAPARGDVVVLASPENGQVLLKRVVAVGGDRVQVRGGALELNGVPVPVSGGPAPREQLGRRAHPLGLGHGGGPDLGPVTVPADQVLVMGDNRGNSHDGRAFGFVPRRTIYGRGVGIFLRAGRPTWQPL
ncbi:MAG TPA: signal peptidase I [Polyangia bacterium]|jgi:signal peptidase I